MFEIWGDNATQKQQKGETEKESQRKKKEVCRNLAPDKITQHC